MVSGRLRREGWERRRVLSFFNRRIRLVREEYWTGNSRLGFSFGFVFD